MIIVIVKKILLLHSLLYPYSEHIIEQLIMDYLPFVVNETNFVLSLFVCVAMASRVV